jgi:type IV secretory pathway component VirB8
MPRCYGLSIFTLTVVLAVVLVLSIFTVLPLERLFSIHLSAQNDKTLTLFSATSCR